MKENGFLSFLEKYGLLSAVVALAPGVAMTLFMMSEAGKFLYYGISFHYVKFNLGDFLGTAPTTVSAYFTGLLLFIFTIYPVYFGLKLLKDERSKPLAIFFLLIAYIWPYTVAYYIFRERSATSDLPLHTLICSLLSFITIVEGIVLLLTIIYKKLIYRKRSTLRFAFKAEPPFNIGSTARKIHYSLVTIFCFITAMSIAYTYGYEQAKKNTVFLSLDDGKTLIIWHDQQTAISIDTVISSSKPFHVIDISKIDTLNFKIVTSDINIRRNKVDKEIFKG